MINKNQKYLMGIINSVTFRCTIFWIEIENLVRNLLFKCLKLAIRRKTFILTEKYFQNFQNFDKCSKNNLNFKCI